MEVVSPPAERKAEDCGTVEPVKRADGSIDWGQTRAKLETQFAGVADDPHTGLPAWQSAFNTLYEQESERSTIARMRAIEIGIAGGVPGTTFAEWLPGLGGRDAILADADLARSTQCSRIQLADGGFLVFSEGMVGALSDQQIADYCQQGFCDITVTPRQQARLAALANAAPFCAAKVEGDPNADPLDAYFDCLGHELRAKGVTP